ncbi:DUF2865 domain-containing protein [Pelagibacterium mangrovi]|uniref:DUF2865 domain-containing protein n=1 Tax=Pelagibacterium mangrovi TaxID=3119828 RepID=UPI002FC76143
MIAVTLGVVFGDISTAMAQTQNCAQLSAIMRGIERNEMFVSFNGIMGELQRRQGEVQQAEGQWSRGGCQQMMSAGQALNQQCQSLARTITLGRSQIEQLNSMAREGQSLARNYQQLSADFARSGCDAGQSGVTFGGQRGNLLDGMFGGGGGGYIDGQYDPWSTQQTRRTVCVRTCDGFYWPISFSTTDSYVAQDAIRCHEMCPGTEVALFSYRNPGEEPEDMISLSGASYRSMPYAFRFRQEVDMNCSCQTREPVGTVAIGGEQGEQSRAAIDFGDLAFPLPQRDPRAGVAAVVADAIYVPLPRPRPRADGTSEATLAQQPDVESNDLRIVEFGDREVRIVGPETPYVPEPEEEP